MLINNAHKNVILCYFEETSGHRCFGSTIGIISVTAGPTSREFAKLFIVERTLEACNRTIPYNYDMISSVPYHMNNIINGYRSLIYSGDHDMTMLSLGTQAWIKSLNYSIIDDWRPWKIKDQIAGYTRTYSNKMTFAIIKASLHVST
ncbi:hypothetical protein Bca101_018750 [Brassica carinata]